MRIFRRAGWFIPPFMFYIIPYIYVVISLSLISCCGGDDAHPSSPKTWAILVYLDGDNNLDTAALSDIKEMEEAASSTYVHVIVQLDLRNEITAKRYRIKDNARELLQDLGEVDMADPETITSFLTWAGDNFPADNTILIVWDHGNGWDKADGSDRVGSSRQSQAVLIDEDNNSSYLPNRSVREAIEKSGLEIDLIGFDACTMGTLEAFYEYSLLPGTEIIVGSQEAGEAHGWDYKAALTALSSDPGMGLEDFASVIVNTYENFYENVFYPANPTYEKRHTISALRTGLIADLAESVNQLAVGLSEKLDNPETRDETVLLIGDMRDVVQSMDPYIQPYVYIDLAHMDSLLGMDTDIASIVSEATVAEYHGSARENASGISIVFFKLPEAVEYRTYDPNYMNYDAQAQGGTGTTAGFINAYQWDEFLHRYYYYSGFLAE